MKNMLSVCLLVSCFYACAPMAHETVSFSGKLVKRGVCGQRVVQILGEPADGLQFVPNWTDTASGNTYERVFTVSNACDFPETIKEGDWFNFTVTPIHGTRCTQCYAYAATPPAENNILAAGMVYIVMKPLAMKASR